MDFKHFLKELTTHPGVYQMLDKHNQILYVGKAKNLKARVSSYFLKNVSPKTQSLMQNMETIQVIVTPSENDALILENNLIKKYRPRFNILFRDDKSYPYIMANPKHTYPRLMFYRGKKNKSNIFFGPYPSVQSIRETLNFLQKVFLLRSCTDTFFKNRTRPCLQYQIKRCSAPCVNKISEKDYQTDFNAALEFLSGKSDTLIQSLQNKMKEASKNLAFETAAHYRDQIKYLRESQVTSSVEKGQYNTDVIAVHKQGEIACIYLLIIRDGRILGNRLFWPTFILEHNESEIIESFIMHYYTETGHDIPNTIIAPSLKQLEHIQNSLTQEINKTLTIKSHMRGVVSQWINIAQRGVEQAISMHITQKALMLEKFSTLAKNLNLNHIPERIECFDISHHQGEATVASCVVFNQQGPLNREYRRFNITDVTLNDDVHALEQAVTRRYLRVTKETLTLPDLIVIDGGKPQLNQVKIVLKNLGLDEIPIIAIAKGPSRKAGHEILFFNNAQNPHYWKPDDLGLHLLQHIRDEAHRFAITHNRKRVSQHKKTSVLAMIPGIGPKRRKQLLQYFGGLSALKNASAQDIAKTPGISHDLALKIYTYFHGE